MKCAVCNWQNRKGETECFNCGAALVAEPPAAVAAAAAAPAPWPQGSVEVASLGLPQPILEAEGAKKSAKAEPAALPQSEGEKAEPTEMARVIAALVDGMALALLFFSLMMGETALIRAIPWMQKDGSLWSILLVLLSTLAPWVWLGWMEARGGTPGKRLMGLRVVERSGQPLGVLRATLRQLRFAMHLPMPGILRFIERLLVGEQGLHNTLLGSYVVRRDADAHTVSDFLAHQHHRRKDWTRVAFWLVVTPLALIAVVVFGVWTYDAWRDWRDPEGAAVRQSLRVVVRDMEPVIDKVQNYRHTADQFAASIEELELASLPHGVQHLLLNSVTGQVVAKLSPEVAQGQLAGQHLEWTPQLRERKGQLRWRRWLCGSRDVPADWLPRNCDDTEKPKPQ